MEKITCPFDLGTSIIDLPKLSGDNIMELKSPINSNSIIQFKKPLNSNGGGFILINDVWDFNNVGVSKQSNLNLELELKMTNGTFKLFKIDKLLICGECDKGPIGFVSSGNEYFLYY